MLGISWYIVHAGYIDDIGWYCHIDVHFTFNACILLLSLLSCSKCCFDLSCVWSILIACFSRHRSRGPAALPSTSVTTHGAATERFGGHSALQGLASMPWVLVFTHWSKSFGKHGKAKSYGKVFSWWLEAICTQHPNGLQMVKPSSASARYRAPLHLKSSLRAEVQAFLSVLQVTRDDMH